MHDSYVTECHTYMQKDKQNLVERRNLSKRSHSQMHDKLNNTHLLRGHILSMTATSMEKGQMKIQKV